MSGPDYWRSQPHGSKLGYVTVMGVVTPPTTSVHGYIWSNTDGWVLNAVKPSDGCNTTKRTYGHNFKPKDLRKKRQRYNIYNLL